jgi:hypothetical protein
MAKVAQIRALVAAGLTDTQIEVRLLSDSSDGVHTWSNPSSSFHALFATMQRAARDVRPVVPCDVLVQIALLRKLKSAAAALGMSSELESVSVGQLRDVAAGEDADTAIADLQRNMALLDVELPSGAVLSREQWSARQPYVMQILETEIACFARAGLAVALANKVAASLFSPDQLAAAISEEDLSHALPVLIHHRPRWEEIILKSRERRAAAARTSGSRDPAKVVPLR